MNVRNLLAYVKERFPPVNMFLFAVLFLTVYSVAHYFFLFSPGPGFLATGIVAVISFFFRLRVFDEIKDFETDLQNHPNRILQSGKVSLRNLIFVATLLFVVEASWSIAGGIVTIVCWLIAIAFSLLMRYEFFCRKFLQRRLFLYAFSHMLIMPLIILWIWSAFEPTHLFAESLYLLAALGFLGGFSFELARKIRAEDAERTGVDSYSKSVGFKTAVALVIFFLTLGVGCQCLLLKGLTARPWTYLVILLLFVVTVLTYLLNLRQAKEKSLRFAELLVSLFMLFSYLSVITEIFLSQ